MDSQEVKAKMCSKEDIVHMLSVIGQYHIPPQDSITLPFLRDVLSGRKRLFKNTELNPVNVPRIPEFQCDRLYQACLEDSTARMYIPEPAADGKRNVSRQYLFNGKSD